MRVAVVGAGYVGLVSGVCLAARGHDVTCVDRSASIVARLNQGLPHIHERRLDRLLSEVVEAGRFRATASIPDALAGVDLVLVAVGTPTVDGEIDLAAVRTAVRDIGQAMAADGRARSVVIKSTVIPGTTDGVLRSDLSESIGDSRVAFGLGMNPEFLREGEAVDDFLNPDRIVLGYEDPSTLRRLEELYAPWKCQLVRVNSRTAELIKYANNALLATQISAVNEIANLAAAVGGIDVMEVMQGVHLDHRWNPIVDGRRLSPGILRYLLPGCGFGGSCFPKDVEALRTQGRALGLGMQMLDAVLTVNQAQPHQVAAILQREVPDLAQRTCLVLGLAFKPETDDVRESASLPIVRDLAGRARRVAVHDPVALANFCRALGDDDRVHPVHDWREEAAGADVIVVATAWDEYRDLSALVLDGKVVFDARRMFAPGALAGAHYLGIGRGALPRSRPAPPRSSTCT